MNFCVCAIVCFLLILFTGLVNLTVLISHNDTSLFLQVQQGMNSGGQLCLDEHNTSRCNSTHAEEKMAAAAARIR